MSGVGEGLASQFLLSEHLAENKTALSRRGSLGKCSSQAAAGDQIAQWEVVRVSISHLLSPGADFAFLCLRVTSITETLQPVRYPGKHDALPLLPHLYREGS